MKKKTVTMSDPLLPPATRMCRCSGCGQYFGSLTGFDRHRAGPVETRRCLTPEELRADGMALDERGYWRLPVRGAGPPASWAEPR